MAEQKYDPLTWHEVPTVTCEWCFAEVRPRFMDKHLGTHIGSMASVLYHLNKPLYDRALAAAGRIWEDMT